MSVTSWSGMLISTGFVLPIVTVYFPARGYRTVGIRSYFTIPEASVAFDCVKGTVIASAMSRKSSVSSGATEVSSPAAAVPSVSYTVMVRARVRGATSTAIGTS